MKKEQFIEEIILNYEHQKIPITNLEEVRKILEEIWLNYLYRVCPSYAISIDPKVIDSTRKFMEEELDLN